MLSYEVFFLFLQIVQYNKYSISADYTHTTPYSSRAAAPTRKSMYRFNQLVYCARKVADLFCVSTALALDCNTRSAAVSADGACS